MTFLSGPDGRLDPVSGEPDGASQTENAVFTFTSDQPGSTFECSFDGADFLPCGGDVTRPGDRVRRWVVENGEHEFVVRATNPQGIVGEEAVYEWLVRARSRHRRAELDVQPRAGERHAAPGGDVHLQRHRQPHAGART